MKRVRTMIFCFFLSLSSCSEQATECGRFCTEEFRTIAVSVENQEGDPVALDSYRVINLDNGREITPDLSPDELQQMREQGRYPIINDSYIEEYRKQELNLEFTGLLGGEEVVTENYKVGFDCCHVYHIAGDLELVLNNPPQSSFYPRG